MIHILKSCLWKNFGAAIDMLINAIDIWPQENLQPHRRFFYMAYHTLVFLDYYLSVQPERFTNTLPFNLGNVPEDGMDDVVLPKFIQKKSCWITHYFAVINANMLLKILLKKILMRHGRMLRNICMKNCAVWLQEILLCLKFCLATCGMCSTIQHS